MLSFQTPTLNVGPTYVGTVERISLLLQYHCLRLACFHGWDFCSKSSHFLFVTKIKSFWGRAWMFCRVSCQAEDCYNRQPGSRLALETLTFNVGTASVFLHSNRLTWPLPEFLGNHNAYFTVYLLAYWSWRSNDTVLTKKNVAIQFSFYQASPTAKPHSIYRWWSLREVFRGRDGKLSSKLVLAFPELRAVIGK